MAIRTVPYMYNSQDIPMFKYITKDGENFINIDEAIDHENELTKKEPKKVPQYEKIWTIQQAINLAFAEQRVVRFLWNGDNKSIKKGIVDLKGCKLMKLEKNSKDVAVVPPNISDFVFG